MHPRSCAARFAIHFMFCCLLFSLLFHISFLAPLNVNILIKHDWTLVHLFSLFFIKLLANSEIPKIALCTSHNNLSVSLFSMFFIFHSFLDIFFSNIILGVSEKMKSLTKIVVPSFLCLVFDCIAVSFFYINLIPYLIHFYLMHLANGITCYFLIAGIILRSHYLA